MGQVGFLTTEWVPAAGTRNGLFIAPSATVVRRKLDIYEESDRIARYDLSSYYGSLDIGAAFTRYGEIRLGVCSPHEGDAEYRTAGSRAPAELYVARGDHVAVVLDQLDNSNFPREGFAASLDLLASITALGEDDYTRWDLNAVGANPWPAFHRRRRPLCRRARRR